MTMVVERRQEEIGRILSGMDRNAGYARWRGNGEWAAHEAVCSDDTMAKLLSVGAVTVARRGDDGRPALVALAKKGRDWLQSGGGAAGK